jgi:hypothetical protein
MRMANPLYFVQECPTCGRNLQVRVVYLGKNVVCQHCQGNFLACDPASGSSVSTDSGSGLLKRADELLESMSARTAPTAAR